MQLAEGASPGTGNVAVSLSFMVTRVSQRPGVSLGYNAVRFEDIQRVSTDPASSTTTGCYAMEPFDLVTFVDFGLFPWRFSLQGLFR